MSSILRTAQSELRKHNLDTFVDELHGVVTPGCPHCKKAFYTISQFAEHSANDGGASEGYYKLEPTGRLTEY